jgi:hypothetical protein
LFYSDFQKVLIQINYKMNIRNITNWNVLFFAAFLALSFVACELDTATGCTDPEAENYDIGAITDSGNCIYAADALVGSYAGSSECSGTLTNPGFNTSSLSFSIAKSTTLGENDVELTLPFEGEAFVFRGTVAGNVLTINDEIIGVNYPNPADPTETIVADVEGMGSFTFFDDDNSLDGPEFTMIIRNNGSGGTIEDGTCMIIGIKQ